MTRTYTVEQDDRAYTIAGGDHCFFYAFTGDERRFVPVVAVLDVTTELGDAAEEHVQVQLSRGTLSGLGGGLTVAARSLDAFDTAASSSWDVSANVITWASRVNLLSTGFNVRLGFRAPLPRAAIAGTSEFALWMPSTLADDVLLSGTLTYQEVTE